MSDVASGPGRSAVPALIVAAVALAADQLTKAIARASIEPGERVDLAFGVDLVRVANDGIAFGMLDEVPTGILVLVAIGFLGLIGWFLLGEDRPGLWLPVGLLAGGALGNLVDRVRLGAVTDFIDPPRWPAFNLADVEITAGVILLLVAFLRNPQESGNVRDSGEQR